MQFVSKAQSQGGMPGEAEWEASSGTQASVRSTVEKADHLMPSVTRSQSVTVTCTSSQSLSPSGSFICGESGKPPCPLQHVRTPLL